MTDDERTASEAHRGAPDEPVESTTAHAGDDAATEAPQGDTAPTAREHAAPGLARTVTVISLRVVRGLAGVAVAIAVVAAVGLVPAPSASVDPLSVRVEPEPADLVRSCIGPVQRLGDDGGGNAGLPSPVGRSEVTVAAVGGTPDRTGGDGGPETLTLSPGTDAALAAAQAQQLGGQADIRGLAVSACEEPSGSHWLVGGSATVGRTTLLVVGNPTAVAADVAIELWGESGRVTAPGMSGISIAPGAQRVIPLSGFAPGLASPVVHVTARGGQVVAALQTSIVRVLDPGGIAVVSPGMAPSTELLVPGVRIYDQAGVSSSLGLDDHADLDAIVRIGNPGDAAADVDVAVISATDGSTVTSFPFPVPAGTVVDLSLALALQLGATPIPDGAYTVSLSASEPIVAGVRSSTISAPTTDRDGDIVPGPADTAWFAASGTLTGDVALAVADAPAPVLVLANPDTSEHVATIESIAGGEPGQLVVPAESSISVALVRDSGYLLRDADGLHAAVSFAAPGVVGGYILTAPRAADGALVVRP